MSEPRVRVFLATSLDGFIAGPGGDVEWLSGHTGAEETLTPFFRQIGALLMGRRTYDVLEGFGGDWPYGDTPVLVATRRPLEPAVPTVRAVSGPIGELLDVAREAAGGRDVYLDGGELVRQGLEAGRVDELTLTLVPILLGDGIPLFADLRRRHPLELLSARPLGGGLVQLRYRPAGGEAGGPAGRPAAGKAGEKAGRED